MTVLLKIVIILIVNEYCSGFIRNCSDKLIGVTVLFRHGDRAPQFSFPKDPYLDIKYWPNGFGQLLDKGKERQFNLGRWLRFQYKLFIPDRYNVKDILVKSSDTDRAIMSAASTLAGLYYPTNKSSYWHKNLAWEPIPIHTQTFECDNIISMSKECAKFKNLFNTILNSIYFQKILQRHKSIKRIIEENSGSIIQDITDFENIYNVFYIYLMHNSTYLPQWAKKINFPELAYLAGLSFSIKTFTPNLQRLMVGPFFNYLHNYFDGIINGKSPKFLMLAAHDKTIVSILNTYGVYNYDPPKFSEMIIWELYKTIDNNIYLKIYRKQENHLEELQLTYCTKQCSYKQYRKILKPISIKPDQWDIECNEI